MCGIAGVYNIERDANVSSSLLESMADAIHHRGPDESTFYREHNVGLACKRLSIIDVLHGSQPFVSDDGSVVLVCNGEIFNYRSLRSTLQQKGYKFRTNCDVEVILFLYLEYGLDFLNQLNGQFAFAVFDKKRQRLFLARDQFGICPLFYTISNGSLIFASEVKAILRHPSVKPEIDLCGLDQIISLPGLVSPRTMFKGISSVKPGNYITMSGSELTFVEYWDLDYPHLEAEDHGKPESYYIEQLDDLLRKSIKLRLNADVPVGLYLSGGLDSSLIGGMMRHFDGRSISSFSIGFPNSSNAAIDERRYQRLMAGHIQSDHTEINFDWQEINRQLEDAVYYAESPLKESYNVCSLRLSKTLRDNGFKVALCGEGADELFGGYIGYKLDQVRKQQFTRKEVSDFINDQIREKLWVNEDLHYEGDFDQLNEARETLYCGDVLTQIESLNHVGETPFNRDRLVNRHIFNQRSYLDFKVRLAGHLIADHGDRMGYANGIECRYPFLDIELVELVKKIPPKLKLNGMVEKYILKEVSKKYIPAEIINRQKFGFVAPGSEQLLLHKSEWVEDILSFERIKRDGYFNPINVERLKKQVREKSSLDVAYETDLVMILLTFHIFLDKFGIK